MSITLKNLKQGGDWRGPEGRMNDEGDGRFGVQSVETAGLLLRALLHHDGPHRLSDIARVAGLNPAKAHRYLVSLARAGLAVQYGEGGLYDLGPLALQMALKAMARFDVLRHAGEAVERLSDQLGETVALVVWSDQGPRFIRLVEARHSLAGSVPISHICPMTWSATGLLFTAFEAPSRTEPLVDREIKLNCLLDHPLAPKSRAELEATLAEIRAGGISRATDPGRSGYVAVCAPIWDAGGRLMMALTVFGNSARMNVAADSDFVRIVRAAAEELTDEMSGRSMPR
jgi:DNA-binding IclR family transcriptional regulator